MLWRRLLALALVALLVAVALAACGDDDDDDAAEMGGAPAQQRVEVMLVDHDIQMRTALNAGPTTFVVNNAGQIDHNFEIEGQGIEEEFDDNLKPGDTKELTVDLVPGTYRVYCPVGSHADMGMEIEVVVE